jgi:hypothetical protein
MKMTRSCSETKTQFATGVGLILTRTEEGKTHQFPLNEVDPCFSFDGRRREQDEFSLRKDEARRNGKATD